MREDITIGPSVGETATVRRGHVTEKRKNRTAAVETAKRNPKKEKVGLSTRTRGHWEEETKGACGKTPINDSFRYFELFWGQGNFIFKIFLLDRFDCMLNLKKERTSFNSYAFCAMKESV